MKIARLTIIILALYFFSGCSDQKLEDKNRVLEGKIAELSAIIEYRDSAASLAAGCDWIFPMCPTSTVADGRVRVAHGYYTLGPWMWAMLILKSLCLVSGLGVLSLCSAWVWARTGRPSAVKTEIAKTLVAEAQAKAKTVTDAAAADLAKLRAAENKLLQKIEGYENRAADARAQALDAESDLHALTAKVISTQAKIEDLQEVRTALYKAGR